MANRVRGEATATVDGRSYTLVLDYNAISGFEEATDQSWMLFAGRFESGTARVGDMRHLAHQALLRHHPDATLQLAGDVMSEDMDALTNCIAAAFPPAPEGEAEGNPPAAAE